MPTPSDSTDNIPLQLERSAHTTCPPETDRPGQWRREVLEHLDGVAAEDAHGDGAPQHQEAPAEEDSPGPMDTNHESAQEKTQDHTNIMETSEPSPQILGASPSSSHADDKEGEQTLAPAPTSSALELQYSIRYGIESTRVCGSRNYLWNAPS